MRTANTLRCLALVAVFYFGGAPSRAETGEDVYVENCASCHGEDGKARTPAGKKARAKDLTASKLPDAEIERQIVLGGPKDAKGHQAMPAFKDTLTPEQIAAVISYVKTLRQ